MEAGAAGWSPAAPVVFDDRQWRRAARTVAQRARAPGGVPLLSARGNPVLGATIRAVGHRPRALLELGYGAVRSHMLVVDTTGAGKATALVRLWAGVWVASRGRDRRGGEGRGGRGGGGAGGGGEGGAGGGGGRGGGGDSVAG